MLRTDLPQFDISENIIIGTDITEEILAFYKQPFRLKAGIFVLCLEGEIHASIKMTDYYIKKNDFVSILPGNILQFIGQQGKVRLCFVAFSSEFLSQTNMVKFSADFLPQVIENPVISLKQESAELLAEYFSLLVKPRNRSQKYSIRKLPRASYNRCCKESDTCIRNIHGIRLPLPGKKKSGNSLSDLSCNIIHENVPSHFTPNN